MMTDARGKLGGQVFSKNRAGAYVRTKVTPVNPRTSHQQDSRFLLGSLSQQWSGLTRAQIEAWNSAVSDWARTDIFGDLRNPTGKNLFTALNKNLIQAGFPAVTLPPERKVMPIVVLTGAAYSIGAPKLDVSLTGNTAGVKLQFRATPILSNGTTFVTDKLRVVDYVAGSAAANADLTTEYENRFAPATAISNNIWVEMRIVLSTGQVSPPQLVKVTMGA